MGNLDSMEILHICPKSKKLNTLEEFEIYRAQQCHKESEIVLNEKLHFKSNIIFNKLISDNTRPAVPLYVRTNKEEEEIT